MPVTNVKSKWSGGDLVFSNTTGARGQVVGPILSPGSTSPGIEHLLLVETTAVAKGATTVTTNNDITVAHKVRIFDVTAVQKATGSTGVRLKVGNTSAAITDTVASTDADKHVVRFTQIDDAQWDVASGGKIRVTTITASSETTPALSWFIRCMVTS